MRQRGGCDAGASVAHGDDPFGRARHHAHRDGVVGGRELERVVQQVGDGALEQFIVHLYRQWGGGGRFEPQRGATRCGAFGKAQTDIVEDLGKVHPHRVQAEARLVQHRQVAE